MRVRQFAEVLVVEGVTVVECNCRNACLLYIHGPDVSGRVRAIKIAACAGRFDVEGERVYPARHWKAFFQGKGRQSAPPCCYGGKLLMLIGRRAETHESTLDVVQ